MSSSAKIAVASGKGGTGKTTVAVNLFASLIKQNGLSVTLSDCDVEEPNALLFFPGTPKHVQDVTAFVPRIIKDKCVLCGECARICAFNAIVFLREPAHIQVIPQLCKGCGACTWVCRHHAIREEQQKLGEIHILKMGGHSLQEGRLELGSPFTVPVIQQLKAITPNNEVVIYDCPPGTSCPVIEAVHDADYVIVVTEPTPFGLSDLKLMTQTLKKLGKTAGVVINKATPDHSILHDYLKKENLPVLIEIPFHQRLAGHYSKGHLFVDIHRAYDNMFRSLYDKICNQIHTGGRP